MSELKGALHLALLMREPIPPAIKAGIARNFGIPPPLGRVVVKGVWLQGGRRFCLMFKRDRSRPQNYGVTVDHVAIILLKKRHKVLELKRPPIAVVQERHGPHYLCHVFVPFGFLELFCPPLAYCADLARNSIPVIKPRP